MKPGDLVQFSDDGAWPSHIAGRLGLITSVRQSDSRWYKFFFDAIVDGNLNLGFGYSRVWDGAHDPVRVINEAR